MHVPYKLPNGNIASASSAGHVSMSNRGGLVAPSSPLLCPFPFSRACVLACLLAAQRHNYTLPSTACVAIYWYHDIYIDLTLANSIMLRLFHFIFRN
jgi:hypothetical protein